MKRVHLDIAQKLSASDYYRGILPYRYLSQSLAEEKILLTYSHGRGLGEKDEIAAVYKRFLIEPEYFIHLLDRQFNGMKLAYDVDDLLLSIPEENGVNLSNRQKESIKASARHADVLVASTQTLATEMCRDAGRDLTKQKWKVCPNMLDLRDWGWVSPDGRINGAHPPDTDQIRIVWAGTNTHDEDLKIITDPLLRVCEKHPNVLVYVMGDSVPDWITQKFPQIQEVPFVPFAQYPTALRSLRPHIGLCPLQDTRFNSAKTAVKWMEYTASGAAVISSEGATWESPYDKLDSRIVYRASSESEWFDCISDLVGNHERRQKRWVLSGQYLVDDHSWQKCAKGRDLWRELFRYLAS